ncbi:MULTISPECIES: aldehyde dehydrogenase family protein [Sphingobium]|uniref:Aldehyde dehydrogenase n=1 Tax=Sphingobium cupriresistens LL01 TaxID=1420583 RepID=A0A0J8AVI3_9SPHN|nr:MULTISPECIES: aldehyde dehydrogenase family protein [Sphingobium]KMS58220.1 aldehyde dehydrogenase [Sphingobium cupriresistens LL01]WCP14868.1 Phenylacetaldehyde dehydrogenase [Sphingobium sp. AntQ-1]
MHRLLIDGKLVDGARTMEVVNPATGKAFASCARADAQQLDDAVAAAKAAFPAWAARPFAERRQLLESYADAIDARKDEFARLLTREQGKPLPQAAYEMEGAIALLRTFAAMELGLEEIRDDGATRLIRQWSPLGVVAAITPWNFPMLLLMMKLAPALSAGNTMVAKPAPTTPLTTLLLGEVAATILPPGVLNIIVDDNDLGGQLTTHPDVAKVSFTGSTATGKKVMHSVADTLKRLTLELGGNDAAIVLDDADVDVVAPAIFQAATLNAGQICLAAKRVYAPASLYDALCDALAKLAADAVVDDGDKQGTQIGPIQNRAQFEKLKGFLDDAHSSGSVIAGGAPLDRDGYFIAPTIVKDIGDDARLVRDEQFGPILPILAYDTIEDAIARANDSEYGLGGTIWTSNPERAIAVALQIDSGTVWINKHLDLPFDVPFGGAKQSGFGAELGREGLEEFTQSKIVNVAL